MKNEVVADCRQLFHLMRGFWLRFGQRLGAVLTRTGLNVPQYSGLVVLRALGEPTMGQLSRRLHVTMGAATNIIDKLVRPGFVSRARSESDRRVVHVTLTPEGCKVLDRIETESVRIIVEIMGEVSAERRREFIESYAEIIRIADAHEESGTTEEGG